MASGKSNLTSLYQQRKKLPSDPGAKGSKPRLSARRGKDEESGLSAASSGSAAAQPPALVSGGNLDVDDDYDDLEEALRQFDVNMQYGPCLGISRLERWERAERLGMKPPVEVREILERVGGAPTCLWEGRV